MSDGPNWLGPQPDPSHFERNHEIALSYVQGGTYDSAGEPHGLSHERVRQVVRRELRRVATEQGIDAEITSRSIRADADMWERALRSVGPRSK